MDVYSYNPLPENKVLDESKMKACADYKPTVVMVISVFDGEENIVRKRTKCWLPAFFPFSTMFSTLFKKICKH